MPFRVHLPAGGDKLKKQKAVADKLRKEVGEAEADITRKGVQAKAGAKNADKMKKEMAKDGGGWAGLG